MSVTLDELQRLVRSRLSEGDTEFFTEQNVTDWLNEAQDVVATEMGILVMSVWSTQTVRGWGSFMLPMECLSVTSVQLRETDGSIWPIDPLEKNTLRSLRSGSIPATSDRPTYYVVRTGSHGRRIIELSHAFETTGLKFVVEGRRRPPLMTELTDVCGVPEHTKQALVDYALWQAKKKDEEVSQAEQAEKQFREDLRAIYEERFKAQTQAFNQSVLHRGSRGKLRGVYR